MSSEAATAGSKRAPSPSPAADAHAQEPATKKARAADEVHFQPRHHDPLVPYLCVKGAAGALEFYQRAFGAEVVKAKRTKDGASVLHAELRIAGGTIMVADEFPGWSQSPLTLGGTGVSLCVYVPDVDAFAAQAVAAGARQADETADMFWGDRCAMVVDPYGHEWTLCTHLEDLTTEEMQARNATARGHERPADLPKPIAPEGPRPKGYQPITPYLRVPNVAAALAYLKAAYGAVEGYKLGPPPRDGQPPVIYHAEACFRGTTVLLAQESKERGSPSPLSLGASATSFCLYVPDVDAVYAAAIAAGATGAQPPKVQFWGDKTADIVDQAGHKWMLSQHVEDVSDEEMERRMAEWFKAEAAAKAGAETKPAQE